MAQHGLSCCGHSRFPGLHRTIQKPKLLSFRNSLEMVVTYQLLSQYPPWLRRSDYSACALSLTIKSEMSTRISLAYEISIYGDMWLVYDDTIGWISVMHFFFNKEIILVEFVFCLKKKGNVISRALRLHNPSHNTLSHQEPYRLEKETHYCTPMKGVFVKALARGEGGVSTSISLKHRMRYYQIDFTQANSNQLSSSAVS